MPYIKTTNGLNCHYEIEGDGPALVFIHGWGVNLKVWRQQVKYFSCKYKVLSLDLPGHGESSWKSMSLSQIAQDCRELIEYLGLNNVILVGSSMGGLVSLKIFEVCPQRIKAIILVGSQPKFVKTDDYPFGLDDGQIQKIHSQVNSNFPSMLHIFFRSLFTIDERKTRRFKWIHTFRKTDIIPEKEALLSLLYVLRDEDLRPVLDNIPIPVHFICGTQDYICQKEMVDYWNGRIPKASIYLFDKCGHFPFLSKPHEFNQVMESFLVSLTGT